MGNNKSRLFIYWSNYIISSIIYHLYFILLKKYILRQFLTLVIFNKNNIIWRMFVFGILTNFRVGFTEIIFTKRLGYYYYYYYYYFQLQ